MVEEANQNRPPFPAEGMARCISDEGMRGDLKIGEVVYIREIPNMRGHCVILRNERMPLVGYHLDRFELLDEDDVWEQKRSRKGVRTIFHDRPGSLRR
jgi:hypothetical protein